MLTRKQLQLYKFIVDFQARTGLSPSFDEMKAGINLASKSGVHRLIMSLQERGFIARLNHRARALTVLRGPDGKPLPGVVPPPNNLETRSQTSFKILSALSEKSSICLARSSAIECP